MAILRPVWKNWLKILRTRKVNPTHFATHFKSLHRADYRTITLALAFLAFLSGGALGVIANSHIQDSSKIDSSKIETPESTEFVRQSAAVNSKEAVEMPVDDGRLRVKQQAETKKYLTKMNAAQQAFYQANQRFAATLEELERSASVISQSSSYSYKLTVYDQTRTRIVAVPKISGLKSFTAAVFLATPPIGTMAPITTICETNTPSQVPPAMPQLVGRTAECRAGSSRSL